MDFKQRQFRCKIKGDAGVYEVWAVDWYNQSVLVYRACGYEWLPFDKIQSLMRYIGHKDRKGVEVYEGDVIERYFVHAPSNRQVVTQTQAGWNPFIDDMTTDKADRYEVIGNIHENPDLCK